MTFKIIIIINKNMVIQKIKLEDLKQISSLLYYIYSFQIYNIIRIQFNHNNNNTSNINNNNNNLVKLNNINKVYVELWYTGQKVLTRTCSNYNLKEK